MCAQSKKNWITVCVVEMLFTHCVLYEEDTDEAVACEFVHVNVCVGN